MDTPSVWITIGGGNLIKWCGTFCGTASGQVIGPYTDTLLQMYKDAGYYIEL